MGPFDDSAGALAFWIFVALVSLGGIFSNLIRHAETQKTIRKAIERGDPIDPALFQDPQSQPDPKPEYLVLAGVIVIASGLGLGVLSIFIGFDSGGPVYPLTGVGILAILVGIALTGFGVWALRRATGKDDLGR